MLTTATTDTTMTTTAAMPTPKRFHEILTSVGPPSRSIELVTNTVSVRLMVVLRTNIWPNFRSGCSDVAHSRAALSAVV